MRVICAPDSFKESISASEAAEAMARGVRAAGGEADVCPIADGGEGTVDALTTATGGEIRTARVTGPLGEPVDAAWGMLGDVPDQPRTAVVEMAAASGLPLVPKDQRDPTKTTTFGTGEVIRAALDAGAGRIILGIGGSATTDGGAGAAQALAARFLDEHGQAIDAPMAGGLLERIARIDLAPLDPRLNEIELVIASDVTNPLTGDQGAAAVYAPQKGASHAQVQQLDAALAHLAKRIEQATGRDVTSLPGAGAAGGLGAGAMALLGGELRSGAELVLDVVGFARRVQNSDLCLTGEGKLDGQSLSGKAILTVAKAAGQAGVPTIALVGALGPDAERTREAGLDDIVVVGEGLPAEESMARAAELVETAARQVVRSRG
ncbi:MAG: glycerate kinase [Phycisphaeraceae bacterium]